MEHRNEGLDDTLYLPHIVTQESISHSDRAIAKQLKHQTHDVHERLHVHPITSRLISPSLNLSHYILTLNAFERFYGAIEAQASKIQSINFGTSLIKKDLSYFGESRNSLPHFKLASFIHDLNTHLGVQYVLFGSQMGGQLIAKNLKKTLGIQQDTGAAFFVGSGKQTACIWKTFLRNLDALCTDRKACILAAQTTFQCLEEWLWHVWDSSQEDISLRSHLPQNRISL